MVNFFGKKVAALHVCLLAIIVTILLVSCIGVDAGLTVKANGSGTFALEYRVSRMAEALGKLDGNERWQTIPVGQADFQRTVDRLPNLRLRSFSGGMQGDAVVNKAVLEFKQIEDLLPFLDPFGTGKYAAFTKENGKSTLSCVLSEGTADIDADLLSLMREVSSGYTFNFSLQAPSTATLTLTDGAGNKIAPPTQARVTATGKKVSLAINSGDLLSLPDGLGFEIAW